MSNQELIISLVLIIGIAILAITLKQPFFVIATIPIIINFLTKYDNNFIRISTIAIMIIVSLFMFQTMKGSNDNDFS